MKQNIEQRRGIDPKDAIDDAQCPNCDSYNLTSRACSDCDWSMPNLSETEITGDHKPYQKCDHCGKGMQVGPCEDCMITEGLKADEKDVEVIEDDDCVVIDNTDSTQATLSELLAESDIRVAGEGDTDE